MGVLDVLFGRKRLQKPAEDRLFALVTAGVTLEHSLGLRFDGVGAVVFKPLSAAEFGRVESEVDELLRASAPQEGSTVERRADPLGYQWVVVRDPELEDAVASVNLVGTELSAGGFGEQLLAAVFRFTSGTRPVHLIYGYKRGAFWPFVPTGEGQKRDNAEELRLKAALERELPIEPDLTRWLGLFDAPLD